MNVKEELESQIELMHALERLEQNEDFKKVILIKYLHDFCIDEVKLSTYLNQDQHYHLARAGATGYFQQYLDSIKAQGIQAEKDLEYFLNEGI